MQNRIQLIMKVKNLSPSQFADQLEIQRSTVSHILSGRNKPGLDLVIKILTSYPEIEPMWLLTGSGPMNKIENKLKNVQLSLEIPELKVEKPNEAALPREIIQETINPVTVPEIPVIAASEKKKESFIPPEIRMEAEKIIMFYPDGTYKQYNPR